jgi:hypothetical protein
MSTAEQVATYKTSGSGFSMQALNAGTLIVHKGCVYTGSATYETDGVPLDGTTLTVGDQSWKAGETVALGGGMIREPSRPNELDSRITVPESCVVTENVWLASPE